MYIVGIIVLELTYITFSERVSLIALFHKVHLIKESTHPLHLLPTGLLSVSSEMCFSYLGDIVGLRNAGLGWLASLKGTERECSRV